ncbi:hypothetical protein IGI04_012373 [Brassica rapa subsp. trilocularis]|uniref:DUF241 domain protein n=1 Tax=Brassica rapa subsp. trilocularis TaxID=1813537 RepID=A0ABQ7N5R3_BRACM|nr:hypothetical protein IGI04_012373 [Brassica rapa subsp. trilocularis]
MAATYHVRSCSLPARLPSNGLNHIQQLLSKLPTDNNNSLSLLSQLYESISHLFNDSPASSLLPHHSFFTHLLDLSLVHLDLCSKLRDITCRIKDCLRDLRSAFRRRGHGGDFTIRCHVKAFVRSRRLIHKDLAKLLLLLKQTDHPSIESTHPLITLLRQVCSQTCRSFRTVMLSLSSSVPKPRPSRWALVSKLVIKNVTNTSAQVHSGDRTEFQMMDEELQRFCSAKEIKKEGIKSLIALLDNVDVVVEDLEESLESVPSRWALVSKLVIKNVTNTSAQVHSGDRTEFQMMDEELQRFCSAKEIKKEGIKSLIALLDNVDVVVEDLEESLESVYRRMIQARVSLLNILSLHI